MTGSIIGDTNPRIPTGGRIRPGIKVLTKKAEQDPEAVRIYREAIANGETFGRIEALIKENTDIQYPLTPRNIPYFVARPKDFSPSDLAAKLLDRYGEIRPDISKHRRLYAFPVIMLFEDWLKNMPHGLAVQTGGGSHYWSEYRDTRTDTGIENIRYCYTHVPVTVDKKAKRGQRVFGGRDKMLNEFMPDGKCEPNECDAYQDGKCKLSGKLIFRVPDIGSGTLMDLTSTSFYSMNQWHAEMLKVFAVRGRISDTHNSEPIFWMTKVQRDIPRIEDGKQVNSKQWLSVLETRIDLDALSTPRAPQLAHNAAAALEGKPHEEFDDEDSAPPADDAENLA